MNEQQRLDALRQLDILDTPPEDRFDRITRIAKAHFNVPVVLISIIDETRQWFKSSLGLNATETPRDISFCGHAILGNEILNIPDALDDPRFFDNPLVTGSPCIRFYAGAPLTTPSGHKIGTLCLIDFTPRHLSHEDLQVLRDLANCVEDQLEGTHLISTSIALNSREAHLRAVLDTVVDGIISIDAYGTINTVNPSAERIFGYRQTELIGKNVRILMPEPYTSAHDSYLTNFVHSGEAKIIGIGREVVGKRKDGSTFPMELAVSEMRQNGQRMFVGITRDITDKKQAEKLKAEFISTVSHELRTPLTSIKGSLGLIRSGAIGELPGKLKPMFDIAYNNSDRVIRLINDILDIEKISAGKMDFMMETINLRTLLEQAIDANKGYGLEHQVHYVITQSHDNAFIKGDPHRLMQVMANLMSNAAKFSPPNATVAMALTPIENGFRISVSDRGPGISKEFQSRLFERFVQADSSDTRQKGGSGLGLSICKAIVESHGGTIGLQTEPGAGSTFHVDFPSLQPFEYSSSESENRTPHRILICEDDPDILALLEFMLQQDGFITDCARSAEQAKKLLNEHNYDAMTLDIGLPDQNGILFIKELRECPETSDLPIIVVSAQASETMNELQGNAIGVVDWLNKPISQERLSESLRRAIRSSVGADAIILHIEDDPDIIKVVSTVIGDIAKVISATTLTEARKRLGEEVYDLIILDLALPDGDGEQIIPFMNMTGKKSTPVIVFSAKEISGNTIEGIKAMLVKSRTTNEALRETIRASIHNKK